MNKNLTPNSKPDIEAVLRKIAQSTQLTPTHSEQQEDMPLLHGEAPRTMWQKIKGGFKYMFVGDKWLQDRRDQTARALEVSRERHADAMQAKQQQFRTMELALSELQRQDNLRFHAEERERDRELQAYLAEAHRLMIEEEGVKNRELARELANLQRELQANEGRLNREQMLKAEMMRAEVNKWVVERQREIHLELRVIDAELQRDLRKSDHDTAIEQLKTQKALQTSPLCAQAEQILVGAPDDGIPPLIILPSPPTLKFEPAGGGSPVGNSPLAQHFPIIEKKLAEALHALTALYVQRGRGLRVIDGGWRSKAAHGRAAALQVFGEIKSEPGLILESTVQGNQFFLNTAFWNTGWREPRYQTVVSLDWHEALYEGIKARCLAWKAKSANKNPEELEKLYGKTAVANFKHNLLIIEREARCLEDGIDLADIDRDYKISSSDSERLGRFVIAVNLLHAAMAADEYFLLWVPFAERQSPLSPLLPLLLPEWFEDAPSKTLSEFIALSVDFYQNLYTTMGEEQTAWLPELFLEFAISLAELPDKSWAWRQIHNALGIFVSLRGGIPEECESSKDLQSCLWELMYARLVETDTGFMEKVNQALEILQDERHVDVAEACFVRGMKNLDESKLQDSATLSKAIVDFSQTLSLQNTHRAAWYQRGVAHLALEQWALAESDFSHALELESNALTLHQRGKARFGLGKLAEAVTDGEAALDLITSDSQDSSGVNLTELEQDIRLFRAVLAADAKLRKEIKHEVEEEARRKQEEEARRKQEKEARSRTKPGNVFSDPLKALKNANGPEMVVIGAGEFKMGDSYSDYAQPTHAVRIAYPFAIGKYPVTFDEYDLFCEETKRNKPSDKGWGREKLPVINVSWQDAVDYCKWLSEQTGNTYRLPSEAEWEYACSAGSAGAYCFDGNRNQLDEYAWFDNNSNSQTHSVGQKKPNAWGLYDMHGNVWEWCEDAWHDNYYNNAPTDGSAWDSGGYEIVIRGGCYNYNNDYCRSTSRSYANNGNYNNNVGFRVVCDVASKIQ
jgi:formylglycine-generating enzyme required for sulfatase activity